MDIKEVLKVFEDMRVEQILAHPEDFKHLVVEKEGDYTVFKMKEMTASISIPEDILKDHSDPQELKELLLERFVVDMAEYVTGIVLLYERQKRPKAA